LRIWPWHRPRILARSAPARAAGGVTCKAAWPLSR
jgi:hypothetical protein